MVHTTRQDITAIAAVGGADGMPNPVEGLVPDGNGEDRHAAGSQLHLAPTIRTGGHMVDRSWPS